MSGRGLGEISPSCSGFGQPAVIGQLLAGLILGPSLFENWVWPAAHDLIFPKSAEQKDLITGLANMGVMMLLLLTGMETDLKLVRRKSASPRVRADYRDGRGRAVRLRLRAGLFPAGFVAAACKPALSSAAPRFSAPRFRFPSIKIVAMVVREMNFMRRNLGQIIVASAILEDTTGWVIVSITLGIARRGRALEMGSLAKTVLGTAIFLILAYTIGRKLVFWLIRWVNDTFVSEFAVITAILIVMCGLALITQGLGVNTVLGAFVAGVLIGEFSHPLTAY